MSQDKIELASAFYRGEARYNCTQAVLAAFRGEAGVSSQAVEAASMAGGGNAAGGTCGALHAAFILLGPDKMDTLSTAFAAEAGSTICHDIRTDRKISCRGCVKLAAKLVADDMEALRAHDSEYAAGLRAREVSLLPMSA